MPVQETKLSIGCCELPKQTSRGKFFKSLGLLESRALKEGGPKLKTLRTWRETSPEHAEFTFIAPKALELISKDLGLLDKCISAVRTIQASALVFHSDSSFSPSATNRDFIRGFFETTATAATLGAQPVWFPGGLWDLESAMRVTKNLDVVVGFDPLANDALEENQSAHDALLQEPSAYMRIGQLGHVKARFPEHQLEELAERVGDLKRAWVVFDNLGKFSDALSLKKLIENSPL